MQKQLKQAQDTFKVDVPGWKFQVPIPKKITLKAPGASGARMENQKPGVPKTARGLHSKAGADLAYLVAPICLASAMSVAAEVPPRCPWELVFF